MTEAFKKKDLSRRTMVKGAAWSVPVLATAVAVPMASASHGGPHFDVGVLSSCVGNYRLGVIDNLVRNVTTLAGLRATVRSTVIQLLGLLGLTEFQTRGFVINAVEGDIPAGETFTLNYPAGAIDLALLTTALNANVLNIVTNTSGAAQLQVPAGGIAQGTTINYDISAAFIIEAGVTGNVTFAYDGMDNPTSGSPAPNSATLNAVVVEVSIGQIISAAQALPGVGGLVATLVGILSPVLGQLGDPITVQLCTGQNDPF